MVKTITKRSNKGGRPRKSLEALRRHHVKVGYTDMEFDTVKYKASETGQRLPDYVRQSSLNAKVEARINDEQLELIRDVSRCGNNINQIAKQANIGGLRNLEIMCKTVLQQVAGLVQRLRDGDSKYISRKVEERFKKELSGRVEAEISNRERRWR